MTQALNLANFANNLNTSGATTNAGLQNSSVTVTAGTAMSGGGAVSLGGSVTLNNAGVTSLVAGTGIAVSGATGAVTVSVSGGGGVTSLNGQTGAVVDTTLDSIGSVVIAAYGGTSNITNGTTVAGSSLYYPNTVTRTPESGTLYSNGTSSTGPRFDNTTQWTNSNGFGDNRGYASIGTVARTTSGNTGWQAPLGASTLSGTWRCMGWAITRTSRYTNNCCGSWTVSSAFITLWVRVS